MKCPQCGIELDEENFLVMDFFKGDNKYWCSECGYQWEIEEKE